MPAETTTAEEQWRPVVGWEGFYEVSDHGRVRSVDRVIRRASGRPFWRKGRILSTAGSVYPQANLNDTHNGRLSVTRVHVLVLEAFVGPCPPGMECRHLDDDKQNNRITNLRWGTRSQNHGEDRRRNGLLTIGVKHGMARLNDSAVLVMRYACRPRAHGRRGLVARLYGVSDATVADAVKGKTWTHVGGPVDTSDRRVYR
jgi:hypothetical protein